MEEIQALMKVATDYLASGNMKDAYFSYLNTLDIVTKELHNIKFVNNVVVSKPTSLTSLFTISRTCMSCAEDIVARPRKNPNLNIAINSSASTTQEENSLGVPHKAPPLPPKPNRRSLKTGGDGSPIKSKNEQQTSITKPPLPPKPVRTPSMKKWLKDVEVSGVGRDAHVVSGEGEGEEGEGDVDSSDSDDEDDEYIHKRNSFTRRSEPSLNVSIASIIRRRSSSPNLSDSTRRRPTITESFTDSPTDEESPYSSHLTSPTTPASFYSAIAVPLSMPNLLDQRPKMINVIPEGAVDPNNLVPATTMSETDNSQLPGSTSSSQYTDHVPEIPASPLIIQHAQMEQKIVTLEAKLAEYRKISKTREADNSDMGENEQSELSTEEINDTIIKYGNTVAGLKQAITRSRKLVFKAANDPDILEFAPHMIAYQLTLIESAIFLEIDPQSLLSHSPKNPDPKITASTDFFNYLTRVVERSILLSPEASSRAQVINHWVKVAVKLHELHNFQTLKAILSALGTPPIKRLKRTWVCIPKKSMVKLENLNELMSEERNYGKYRDTIQREGFLRKPTVPFLGTFIMDATYLLAAVKTVGSSNSSAPTNVQSPRSATFPTGTQALHDDPRIQELLQTLYRYQHGPKYHSNPPVSYIKASTKHHFRTASISAALHRSGNKYNHRNDDDDESIEEKQQLITHYMLTRIWIPEKSVDELSCQREPHKHKFHYNGRTSNPASWGGTPNSSVSNASGAHRGSTGSTVGGSGTSTGGSTSTSSGMGRTSSTSGSGDSRPLSLEDGIDLTSTASAATIKSDKAGPTPDKENFIVKEKERRNITEKVGNFFFGPRGSLDKTRDEKEKEEKIRCGETEKDVEIVDDERAEEAPKNNSDSTSSGGKRTSWRMGMKVMFGGNEASEPLKNQTAMLRSASHSRSSSGADVPLKSHAIFMKVHGRTSSTNSSDTKPFTYTGGGSLRSRSLEESHSSTPPPLYPKPVTLMRSASTSSVTSMGSSASAVSGTRNSIGNSNILHGGSNIDELGDFHMALAKKVANEVAAGGGNLERNWK